MATLVHPSPTAPPPAAPAQPRSRGPWSWFKRWVQRTYDKQIDGTGLAVFRIVFFTVQLCEVIQFYYFRHLLYDPIPYLEKAEVDFTVPLVLWMFTLVLLVLGLWTRFAAVLNFLFVLMMMATMEYFEYHMIYAYQGVALMALFLPLSRCLSLDRLRLKLRYSNTRFQYDPPRTVPQLAYYTPLLIGAAFVYFGSIFFKCASNLWLHGLGMWKPAALPYITHVNNSWLLNNHWLMLTLGYLTFVFELAFLFTFTRKAWRIPLMIVGVGLHLGILWEFPIPWFAIGFAGLYLLMVPVSWWPRLLGRRTAATEPQLRIYYDAECPLCARTRLTLEHLDTRHALQLRSVQTAAATEPALAGIPEAELLRTLYSVDRNGRVRQGFDTYVRALSAIWYLKPLSWLLRVPGISHLGRRVYGYVAENRTTERCTDDTCGYVPPTVPQPDENVKLLQNLTLRDLKLAGVTAGLFLACLLQFIITYESLLIRRWRTAAGFDETRIGQMLHTAVMPVQAASATLFGITNHGVFMDHHFDHYNHEVAVTYTHPDGREEFLPMIRPSGQPGWYIMGAQWVNWTFRVVGAHVDQERLADGIRRYTAFWAKHNGVDLHHARFNIKVKKMEEAHEWQDDFLNRQLAHPWLDAGTVDWENEEFTPHIKTVEQM